MRTSIFVIVSVSSLCVSAALAQSKAPLSSSFAITPPVLNKVWILRKFLNELNPMEAMEFLIGKMSQTKTNKKFLAMMNT